MSHLEKLFGEIVKKRANSRFRETAIQFSKIKSQGFMNRSGYQSNIPIKVHNPDVKWQFLDRNEIVCIIFRKRFGNSYSTQR